MSNVAPLSSPVPSRPSPGRLDPAPQRWSLVVGGHERAAEATPSDAVSVPARRGTLLVARGDLVRLLAEGSIEDLILMPYGELAAHERSEPARTRPAPLAPLHAGALTIDREAREARVDGVAVDLTRREYELVVFFCANPGRAFTRDELLTEVWHTERLEMKRTVDIHVRRLRAKLGRAFPLETVYRVGYRFRATLAASTPTR